LARAGCEDSEVNAPEITAGVGIASPSSGPELDEAEGSSEYLLVRNQLEEVMGNAGAVEAADCHLVAVLEHVVVFDVEVLRDGVVLQRSKQKVDAHTTELHFQQWSVGVLGRYDVLDVVEFKEHALKGAKEMLLALAEVRRNEESVDVGASFVHAEVEGAESEDARVGVGSNFV